MIGAKARRRLLVPIVGLVAALGVAACGSDDDSDSGDSSSDSGGSGTIGFLLPETQTARYETQDKPLFEQKVRSSARTARSSTRTPIRIRPSSSRRSRPWSPRAST